MDVGWREVDKALLNLIKITELSALAPVRQEGLDGGSVWACGVGKRVWWDGWWETH